MLHIKFFVLDLKAILYKEKDWQSALAAAIFLQIYYF